MKLQILSDLHLEMVKPPYSWRIPETAAEDVVLAGDIGVGLSGVNWEDGMRVKAVWHIVKESARSIGVAKLAPHDLDNSGRTLRALEISDSKMSGGSEHEWCARAV
jgi:hypothetical protein